MSGRRFPTPEEEGERNPNQPENDIGGAVGGAAAGGRIRDENALSFRHFLQPQSDLVPQPAPTRSRGNRGGVDLVEATMALPDFVQDHLVLESLSTSAAASVIEPSQDMSPSRPHPHPLVGGGHAFDLNALNDILLPDLGSSSSSHRSSTRNSHPIGRRSDRDCGDRNLDSSSLSAADIAISGGGSALPDFLSDGPMQLNQCGDPNSSSGSGDFLNSSVPGGVARNRTSASNNTNIFTEEPVRGPSFESKESLRAQIDRLRSEVAEKNRKIHQLEADLNSQRNISTNLESSLIVAERNLSRAMEAETQLQNHSRSGDNAINFIGVNGHGGSCLEIDSLDSGTVVDIARSSEILIGQLLQKMQELKKISQEQQGKPGTLNDDTNKSNSSSGEQAKPRTSR